MTEEHVLLTEEDLERSCDTDSDPPTQSRVGFAGAEYTSASLG